LKFYVTFADAQLPIRYDYARATDRRSNVKGKVGIPADITVNVKQTTLFFFNMVIAGSLFPNLKHLRTNRLSFIESSKTAIESICTVLNSSRLRKQSQVNITLKAMFCLSIFILEFQRNFGCGQRHKLTN
jgi:hypothetical protein